MKLARVKVSLSLKLLLFVKKLIAMVEEKSAISCNINDFLKLLFTH